MDPLNNPMSTPTPNPMPASPVPPVSPVSPVSPVPASESPTTPMPTPSVSPAPEPPVVPAVSVQPTMESPVVPPTPEPVVPSMADVSLESDVVMGVTNGPAMTVEKEELGTPMQAAAPVPGSIGSAVSGPADSNMASEVSMGGNQFGVAPEKTQNVAFNDPAAESNMPGAANMAQSAKKPQSKTTLIILIAIAAVAVVALAVILIMQLSANGA